ncbi:MAG: hypothetical protein JO288_09760 [Hyphomicrobiales bacterium]|nr:hypothetical protein [Hyphomicrobiales bacterium]
MNTATHRGGGIVGLTAISLTVASPAPAWNIGIGQAREIAVEAHPGQEIE